MTVGAPDARRLGFPEATTDTELTVASASEWQRVCEHVWLVGLGPPLRWEPVPDHVPRSLLDTIAWINMTVDRTTQHR
jgi:hypothetical protein